ncbi:hypothetical protein NEOLEDRAFT_106203 [Neolentinus lepideus HHB14362 ss-1]|uniref:Uncharacterized protein n=1 Tax=Neolentinus lepideus HHB14362 ss-1 TaxID=1314782 RepID=A0A165U4I8_9AGAM|nr:hypothetical protein NEOLEDRAFT_106203 [Neolentinus lepideus HHB14362 ss-1]
MSSTRIQPVTTPPSNVQSPQPGEADKDLSSSILKAVRAFEHNRQRTKRAEDHVKAKAKKERSKVLSGPVKSTGDAGGKGARKSKSRSIWEDNVADRTVDENMALPPSKSWTASTRRPETMEVKLADLISTKTKSSKSKDSDFELIPHIQSVIVLDDTFLIEEDMSNVGPEEPWEHILGVEDEDAKASAPSYAQVVSQSQ